jgi:hypothetical protein
MVEGVQGELHLVLSTDILSIAVGQLESFSILVAKFTVCFKLHVVKSEFVCFFRLCSLR